MLTIKTNNQPREILSGFALTEKERAEFDYLENIDESSFFRYRGTVYDLGEFMRIDNMPDFDGWHGYASDSFFSGILVKFTDCNDGVIVATYFS